MHKKFLGFVATLTTRPKLVKKFPEMVEREREVDAPFSNLQETVSNLRKRRTKFYQAHIDDRVPIDVLVEVKAALDAETAEAECKLSSARMDEIEIDEVLQFCERVLGNVPMPWKGLQPEGVSYDQKPGYRTPTTCLFQR
jgi:hypothetical protein